MDAKEQNAFWERYLLESPLKDIEVVDSAARQLITVTSLLQGIYFAAISLSDFKKQAAAWQLALLLAPAVLTNGASLTNGIRLVYAGGCQTSARSEPYDHPGFYH